MTSISADRAHLQMKLQDRDEELRGKAKLLDVSLPCESPIFPRFFCISSCLCLSLANFVQQDVQDELVSLNLQFNMAEDRSKKLERENRELVDRWMARMGKEADAMNDASKFS